MFVLIHSPLVGPFTWALVADALAQGGVKAVVPRLTSPSDLQSPYWQRHVDEVAQALESTSEDEPLILVAHSGGGVLLPALGQRLEGRVAAYIFVDAGIPEDGKSRLDLFESFEAAQQFREAAADGLLPVWTSEDLSQVIPDATIRERFVGELRPLLLAVYEEPIPVFDGWPYPLHGNPPCGYLRFGSNPAYDDAARLANQRGWAYRQLDGHHFHMLVEPRAVAMALVELVEAMSLGCG